MQKELYYGTPKKRCANANEKENQWAGKKVLIVYRIIYIAVAVIAPVSALNLVWTIADILNALMSIPNLIAVLLLSGIIVSDTRKYIDNLDAWDEEPVPVVDDHGNEINVPVDTTLMK